MHARTLEQNKQKVDKTEFKTSTVAQLTEIMQGADRFVITIFYIYFKQLVLSYLILYVFIIKNYVLINLKLSYLD